MRELSFEEVEYYTEKITYYSLDISPALQEVLAVEELPLDGVVIVKELRLEWEEIRKFIDQSEQLYESLLE
jgi:hypothetical protein